MTMAVVRVTDPEQRERLFFLIMTGAIGVTVLLGFSLFIAVGISSFGAPWWVHVHAVSFMAWIGLYTAQNVFIYRNNVVRHRQLGRIGAVYAVWLIVLGLVLTPLTLAVGRSPPFFTPAYFLTLDWTNIAVFALLFFAAIANRKRTDWHRRLMLCATICLIAPAWGRLIVLSGSPMTAFNNISALLAYVLAAMLADWMIRGRVHPAYYWGFAALVGMGVAIELLAMFPPLMAFADSIAA